MAKLVSSVYGDALFDLVLEEGRVDAAAEEIRAVREVFLHNEELFTLLNHPEILREEKIALVEKAFGGRVSDEVLGFLCVIITKERHNAMLPIFDHFLRRVKRHEGIGEAVVISAVPLSGEQKAAVRQRLLETSRYRELEIDYQEDPALLGGMVIRMDDRVVDSSLKTQIDTLRRELSEIAIS